MKTPRNEIAEIIARRFGAMDSKTLGNEVAAYLLSEGRVQELGSLLRDVMQARADAGIVEAQATSAFPLSSAVRKEIEAEIRALYPDAKHIIISERHDPDVVGGVKIELANERLDLSIRARLNKFKQLTV